LFYKYKYIIRNQTDNKKIPIYYIIESFSYFLIVTNMYLTVVLPPASVAGITGGSLNFSAAAT